MSVIDFILNLAGLLLWLNWRAAGVDLVSQTTPGTLAGTLRRAEKFQLQRWHLLAALGAMLFIRAFIYWQIGPAVNWTARLDVGVIAISFRADLFGRMLLFSFLSFATFLAALLLWMLLLSLLNGPDATRRLVRNHLGRVAGWPVWVRAILPLLAGALAWWLLNWPLAHWGIVPRPSSGAHRIEQSLLVGAGSYLTWKYIIGGVLLLHLLNSYVYFGSHPLWNAVNVLAKRMLSPLKQIPLAVAKVDFAPVVGIVLVFVFAHVAEHGVMFTKNTGIPGLVDFYLRVAK